MEWANLVNSKYFYLQKAFGRILNGRLMAEIKKEALGDKFAYELATETDGGGSSFQIGNEWRTAAARKQFGDLWAFHFIFIGLCNKNTGPQTVQDRVSNTASISNQKLFSIIN